MAYATQPLPDDSPKPGFGIRAFALDPKTGMVTVFHSLSAITFPPTWCGRGNVFGYPVFCLVGFNLDQSQLISFWSCQGYHDSSDYYYTQSVNQKTGALGPPVATVGAGSSFDEFSTVTFTPNAIFSFQNQGFQGSLNELYVYWPNARLNFSCTYKKLDACSYSNAIATDRTGKFILFCTYAGATEVTQLNMSKKTIEPVGIPLADTIDAFSLDDQIVYGSRVLSWKGQYVIPVYVFDPSTGLVTDNGMEITMPSEYSSLIPALRY